MGYGLSVYCVTREALTRVYGKNDVALLKEALDAIGSKLARYDRELGAPDPDDDADISHEDALREIFAGRFTPHVRGSRYGWALEALCGFLGDWLDNGPFVPCSHQWYTDLDEVLEAHGVPLQFTDLTMRPVLPIPEPDDWPCIGFWDAQDFEAIDALEACMPKVEDRQVKAAFEAASGWIRYALARPGSLIVGFHG